MNKDCIEMIKLMIHKHIPKSKEKQLPGGNIYLHTFYHSRR